MSDNEKTITNMAANLRQVDGYLRLTRTLRAIWLTFLVCEAIVAIRHNARSRC